MHWRHLCVCQTSSTAGRSHIARIKSLFAVMALHSTVRLGGMHCIEIQTVTQVLLRQFPDQARQHRESLIERADRCHHVQANVQLSADGTIEATQSV